MPLLGKINKPRTPSGFPNQKFDLIRISVLHDIITIWNKSTMSKIPKSFSLHNNHNGKLLTNE